MSSLNVIALVSGGKDSFFSILHCLAHGHSVVALANLYPPSSSDDSEQEDLNSFMYQTVGHAVIPLYAEATGIPLFRQEIRGQAVNSERDYAAPSSQLGLDETESLVPLLTNIKASHPEANAISTGAILSTYQRTRVESVAIRLGLTPLSFLWQYPVLPPYSQSALLHDLRAVGQDSRIIKVASGGLDETFLMENVADSKTISRLGMAMSRFSSDGDGAVLGEGGEYETLTLDNDLFKKKIELEPLRVVHGEGGEVIWQAKSARLVEKPGHICPDFSGLKQPDTFDQEFLDVLSSDDLQPRCKSTAPVNPGGACDSSPFNQHHKGDYIVTITSSTKYPLAEGNAAVQIEANLQNIIKGLNEDSLDCSDILHTTLILRDMSDFEAVNKSYGSFFTTPNPPSRVTIAAGNRLPQGVHVVLSVIAAKKTPTAVRKGLHVQSRSYWAPANIGPYSQAISTSLPPSKEDVPCPAEIVFVAGQIPLHPATMTMYKNGTGGPSATALSLQHLFRIGRTLHVKFWLAGIAFIPNLSHEETCLRVDYARHLWTKIHHRKSDSDSDEEAESTDPWDQLNRHGTATFTDTTKPAPLPDFDVLKMSNNANHDAMPPIFVVQVEGLPRSAPVEWSSIGIANLQPNSILVLSDDPHPHSIYAYKIQGSSSVCVVVEVTETSFDQGAMRAIRTANWEHCALYAGPDFPFATWGSLNGVQHIPCQGVWGQNSQPIMGAMVGRINASYFYEDAPVAATEPEDGDTDEDEEEEDEEKDEEDEEVEKIVNILSGEYLFDLNNDSHRDEDDVPTLLRLVYGTPNTTVNPFLPPFPEIEPEVPQLTEEELMMMNDAF